MGNTDRAMVTEINGLLDRWRDGDRSAFDRSISLLHGELRRLAHLQFSRERKNHTLQTHDLVSKLYLKLLGSRTVPWRDHTHFLNAAVRTMRQILIDHARSWAKRAGGRNRVTIETSGGSARPGPDRAADEKALTQMLILNQAIEKMAALDEDMANIADVRLTLGLTLEETARELKLPINKVKRDWLSIRKFLAETVWQEHDVSAEKV